MKSSNHQSINQSINKERKKERKLEFYFKGKGKQKTQTLKAQDSFIPEN
jgi:hypothetical protein